MPRKTYSSSYSCSSSSYDGSDSDGDSAADLFKEAEEMIKNNLAKLFSVSSSCGVKKDRKGRVIHDRTDDPVRPSWRQDPRKSFADWRLVVRDGSTSKTYHIHKGVVSHGPRSSAFFVREFEEYHKVGQSHRRDAASSGGGKAKAVTEVALPKRSATAVPALLDFIYDDKLDLKSSTAPPMRHLADHFDVRELHSLVSSFIQKDLKASTATTYIDQADRVKDKELLGMATEMAAQSLNAVKDPELLTIPPRILPQVLSHPQAFYPSSEWLSELVARYVRGRRQLQDLRQSKDRRQRKQKGGKKNAAPPPPPEPLEEISDETFYFLTHAQILPKIAPNEAIWYLTFSQEAYGADVLGDESMGGK